MKWVPRGISGNSNGEAKVLEQDYVFCSRELVTVQNAASDVIVALTETERLARDPG